jgi:hypothetical protein
MQLQWQLFTGAELERAMMGQGKEDGLDAGINAVILGGVGGSQWRRKSTTG